MYKIVLTTYYSKYNYSRILESITNNKDLNYEEALELPNPKMVYLPVIHSFLVSSIKIYQRGAKTKLVKWTDLGTIYTYIF